METLAEDNPRGLLNAWAALQQFQREWKGDQGIFEDANVRDLKVSIQRANPKPSPREKKSPKREDMAEVLQAGLSSRVPANIRVTALFATLQYRAIQRASSILRASHERLVRAKNQEIALRHTHKTQMTGKRDGEKELVLSETFQGEDVMKLVQKLVQDGIIPRTGPFVPTPWSVTTFNGHLADLWMHVGYGREIAEDLTSHGLRRGGLTTTLNAGWALARYSG